MPYSFNDEPFKPFGLIHAIIALAGIIGAGLAIVGAVQLFT